VTRRPRIPLALAALAMAFAASAAAAPRVVPAGGGALPAPAHDALDPAQRAEIEMRLAIAREVLVPLVPRGAAPVRLGWPLRARDGFADPGYHGISNFVDRDPDGPGKVRDWSCGARSYDLESGYDHGGTDFFLWPFAWSKMFDGDVAVVAAARGTILGKDDGHFDGSCEFSSEPWNAVYVQHDDGTVAWYGHLRAGSLTPKQPGETVEEGEALGLVGSSGSSTSPHLHLELRDEQNQVIDPFEGPCNAAASRWREQIPYYDSALNRISTHDGEPEVFACNTREASRARDRFAPGETVYLASYYRDQLAGQVSVHTLRRPNGSVFVTWEHASDAPHLASSYWFWTSTLPDFAPRGEWHYEVSYLGQQESVAFTVPEPGAVASALAALVGLALAQRGSKKGFQGAARAASTSPIAGACARPAASASRVAARLLR
jgi:murein DD-endopeptidase MepM/ murein hydrolase activator NlpD